MKNQIGILNRLQPLELQFHIKIENPPICPSQSRASAPAPGTYPLSQ